MRLRAEPLGLSTLSKLLFLFCSSETLQGGRNAHEPAVDAFIPSNGATQDSGTTGPPHTVIPWDLRGPYRWHMLRHRATKAAFG